MERHWSFALVTWSKPSDSSPFITLLEEHLTALELQHAWICKWWDTEGPPMTTNDHHTYPIRIRNDAFEGL